MNTWAVTRRSYIYIYKTIRAQYVLKDGIMDPLGHGRSEISSWTTRAALMQRTSQRKNSRKLCVAPLNSYPRTLILRLFGPRGLLMKGLWALFRLRVNPLNP